MRTKEPHQPILIVIAGPNGAGKTTVTSKILHHEWLEDAVYINPNNVAQEIYGGWNDNQAILKAAQYCEEWREQCITEHKSLIFETVLSVDNKIDFIRRAKKAGFFVRLFFVGTNSPRINASRITRRVMEGGHDVPITKIISRYSRSILNCAIASKIADRTYVYDNSIDNEEAQLLFRMTNGQLYKQYVTQLPLWAEPIID